MINAFITNLEFFLIKTILSEFMKLKIKVIPNSSMNLVETELDGSLKVKLTSPPDKGKANKQLVEVLAKHYEISKSKIKILKGQTSRNKILEVEL